MKIDLNTFSAVFESKKEKKSVFMKKNKLKFLHVHALASAKIYKKLRRKSGSF